MPLARCSKLNWEIVVVDDNSPDRTDEVCEQLMKIYGSNIVSESSRLPFRQFFTHAFRARS